MIKAVLFDIGGVVVSSPLAGISKFELLNGIPSNYLNVSIAAMGEQGAWPRLERGELSLSEFYPLFGEELSRSENLIPFQKFLDAKKRPFPSFIPPRIDGEALFKTMMATSVPNSHMVLAIRKLRRAGLKVGALTNNWHSPTGFSSLPQDLHELFDDIVESAKVGLRKPDPKIFQLACSRLGIQPNEVVFLDDLGVNLKAASSLGMKAIRVWLGKEDHAIQELENITNLRLLPDSHL